MTRRFTLLACLVCVNLAGLNLSEAIAHPLDDAISTRKERDETGKEQYFISVKTGLIDRYLDRIGAHAKSYPPRFANDEERRLVTSDLKRLIGVLEIVKENGSDLKLRYAYAQAMAYNLDIDGSGASAVGAFESLLEANPDDPQANYALGMFLAGTGDTTDSIPFLEKALALGKPHAQYTLGLIELEHGSKTEGLRMLEDYCAKYPENAHAQEMLVAARENRLTFYSTPPLN